MNTSEFTFQPNGVSFTIDNPEQLECLTFRNTDTNTTFTPANCSKSSFFACECLFLFFSF